MLVQASFWAVWFAAAVHLAFVVPGDLWGGPSDSAFFLVHLTAVTVGEFGCSFFEFGEFADELIFFEVEFLELSGKDDIGEMEFAIFLIVILLFLFGFLVVLMRRLFEIMFGVDDFNFFVFLLIHWLYVLNLIIDYQFMFL